MGKARNQDESEEPRTEVYQLGPLTRDRPLFSKGDEEGGWGQQIFNYTGATYFTISVEVDIFLLNLPKRLTLPTVISLELFSQFSSRIPCRKVSTPVRNLPTCSLFPFLLLPFIPPMFPQPHSIRYHPPSHISDCNLPVFCKTEDAILPTFLETEVA